MGRKLWAVTVLLLAMVARVFYPQVRMVVQDFLASPSSPSPHIEFPESILSNRPLERLGDLLAPIIKAVLKLAAPHQPLAGSRSIKGLKAAVDISYDDFGVPHIYAQDMRDLYFAQGYVTAHDRMFEMHFHRFLVHGRVAEIVGEVAVESDMLLRMHAFGKMGAAAAKKISPGFLPRLQAYVDGVNAYLNSEDYQAPVEFSIMGLEKPHPWGLDDVLGLVMFQAWQMSEGWNLEIARANIQEHLNVSVTDKIFADIDSIYHPNHPTCASFYIVHCSGSAFFQWFPRVPPSRAKMPTRWPLVSIRSADRTSGSLQASTRLQENRWSVLIPTCRSWCPHSGTKCIWSARRMCAFFSRPVCPSESLCFYCW